jgi:chorismate mutase
MELNQGRLAILVLFAISGTYKARAQNASEELQPLVEVSAHRLDLAEKVALAKWDSQAPVEDPPREAQVIAAAVKEGASKGLKGTFVSKFFNAQIEANKIVQYSLLADWYRNGKAPAHVRIDLAKTVRPELDQLQTALISALADTRTIRADTTCHADTAKAVGKYLSTHKRDAVSAKAIALDRALAAACTF